jgi:hypothetical protein
MLRFAMGMLYALVGVPLFLVWGRGQAEAQIDKMQAAVFNSPGTEAPVPPSVVMAGAGLLAGYGAWSALWGLKGVARWSALLLGAALGLFVYSERNR